MRAVVAIGSLLALASCATGTSSYEAIPAAQKKIANSLTTNIAFDAVWDSVVSKLAQTFFVINNIDKQSRIINVTFSSPDPELYVDCGRSKRQFDFQNEHQLYEYPVAASNTYRTMGTWNPGGVDLPAVLTVTRTTKLDGRANIYIAPAPDGAGSVVSVNANYVWSVTTSGRGDGYNVVGALVNRNVGLTPSTSSIGFTTQTMGRDGFGPDLVSCGSTGKFEESLLSFVPR